MPGSSIGNIFRLHTFGESHGPAIGGIIDGFPAGFKIDTVAIQHQLDRRKPGQSDITTDRRESDQVEFLSGIMNNVTTGAPIGFIIRNEDHRSADYSVLEKAYRPSHADYTYDQKFGLRDFRGGGRASARETISRVVAGALANQFLSKTGIQISSFVSQVGPIKIPIPIDEIDLKKTDSNIVRCPHDETAEEMQKYIRDLKLAGDTIGGVITCVIHGCPAGLGEPVFDKLHAELGKAMLSINAVKGFEIGSGFSSIEMKGSEHNDLFYTKNNKIHTLTNNSGGIQGGISNGENIYFRVGFKPVATIAKEQPSINQKAENIKLQVKGRHDPCVVPRAVPIVDAMAAIVILDFFLINQAIKSSFISSEHQN